MIHRKQTSEEKAVVGAMKGAGLSTDTIEMFLCVAELVNYSRSNEVTLRSILETLPVLVPDEKLKSHLPQIIRSCVLAVDFQKQVKGFLE